MPRTKTSPARKTCSVILPEDHLTVLQEAAAREERTISAQIRLLVAEWVKRQGKPQKQG